MTWEWLTFWHRKRARAVPHWRVVMYTRSGCHLCDDAWALLESARRHHGFTLTKADVDADPELAARYGMEVPVVEVNGKVRFRGVVNAVLLRRLFEAAED
jgi:glutaredoxin